MIIGGLFDKLTYVEAEDIINELESENFKTLLPDILNEIN
jgi:hypothetical protein